MAKRRPRLSEAEKDRAHERFLMRWSTFKVLGSQLIWALAVVGVAFVALYLPTTVAPGEKTVVEVSQNLAANINLHVWIAWGVAGAATIAWKRERKARLLERKEKDARLRQFENKADPNVTSSGLNLEGTKPQEGAQ